MCNAEKESKQKSEMGSNEESQLSKIPIIKIEDELFEHKDSNPIVKYLFNTSNIGILSLIEQEELLIRKQEKKYNGRSFSKPNKNPNKSIGDFEDNYTNDASKNILRIQAYPNKRHTKVQPHQFDFEG